MIFTSNPPFRMLIRTWFEFEIKECRFQKPIFVDGQVRASDVHETNPSLFKFHDETSRRLERRLSIYSVWIRLKVDIIYNCLMSQISDVWPV